MSTAAAYRIVGEHLQPSGHRPALMVVDDGLRGVRRDARARLTMVQPLGTAVVQLP